jgi:hypothetical protein
MGYSVKEEIILKTTMRTIVLAIPALSKLAAGDLSLRLAYRLKRSIDAIQKEADFFSQQRKKILDKYGTPDERGDYTFEDGQEAKAITELDELLELEVTLDIQMMVIPITEELRLSVNDIETMAPFVEFKEEE